MINDIPMKSTQKALTLLGAAWRNDKKIAGISNNDIWVDGTPATVTRAIRIIKEKGF